MKKIILTLSAIALSLTSSIIFSKDFPSKPITMVVGFGVGGSADRMARAISAAWSKELGVPIKVINKKGAGTALASNFVLRKPADGYTVYASTFVPYIATSIVINKANFKPTDFSTLNFQWFDNELLALSKDSKYKTFAELIEAIKTKPKTVKASVLQGSGGHLLLQIMLDRLNIPEENLNIVTYNSGGKARTAVAGGQVDLIAISAQGSEKIREFLNPLGILDDKSSKAWGVPTINELLKPYGIKVPVYSGSVRGVVVSAKTKSKYPKRFDKLVASLQKTLANKELQEELKKAKIGGNWTGPEKSQKLFNDSFSIFEKYLKKYSKASK